ncbi:hypothetical protein GOBAR_DD09922 [Gossypium barbadense]|nr:hypothetical protein GOBAR_DD09922 [Gossypium barbadense]
MAKRFGWIFSLRCLYEGINNFRHQKKVTNALTLFLFHFDGTNAKLQVVRCCLEHAASVAKTFLMSDCVVVEIKEPEHVPAGNPMDNSGYGY